MPSPYTYVNSVLPTSWAPPRIVRERICSESELAELVLSNDPAIAAARDGSIEERILSVFVHEEVLFGDPGFIPANRDRWLENIGHFVKQDLPLQFVAMAFAYKMPNPLKTNRMAPDIGEVLMLRRFKAVLDTIETIYAPGGRLTILEEGILGRCQGVDQASIDAYRRGTPACARIANLKEGQLDFHSLDDMVHQIPNFEARWLFEQERMRELWQQDDPAVLDAYNVTFPNARTSVPMLDYPHAVVAAAYDASQTDSALRYPRDYIDKIAHRKFFAYRSLLALRDATGFLHDLRPHALKLTVSPKPENLSVVPINRWSGILPYHGVPVLHADGRWEILYLGSLGSAVGHVEALHLDGDEDAAPIAYRVVSE
ncbi:L-tyrosine/L-tryptophan isonitrile synthase family protein [Aliirhizobium smilacinae]|jgi:hypothetical protein|uniref:Uncharacterized protein n=1 Tax=Aliirhizobium smilacinae TaxID=1395944 RepID=A0A5C4XLM4_9HYPH|nr:L-tyrosine/L-tryptophan isonitrile synthase family protein [Rhizobium smilacinae]TNM63560.1 hypothetical protein FHP24_12195 [Rhizobium smilacinae]